MIDGIDLIFILPPIIVLVLAFGYGIFRLVKTGPVKAGVSFIKVIFYGGLVLVALFVVFVGFYYSTGGH